MLKRYSDRKPLKSTVKRFEVCFESMVKLQSEVDQCSQTPTSVDVLMTLPSERFIQPLQASVHGSTRLGYAILMNTMFMILTRSTKNSF
jgi:hypothetical protein